MLSNWKCTQDHIKFLVKNREFKKLKMISVQLFVKTDIKSGVNEAWPLHCHERINRTSNCIVWANWSWRKRYAKHNHIRVEYFKGDIFGSCQQLKKKKNPTISNLIIQNLKKRQKKEHFYHWQFYSPFNLTKREHIRLEKGVELPGSIC